MTDNTNKTKAEAQGEMLQVIREADLEKTTATQLKDSFMPFFEQASEWREKAMALNVTDESQTELMKQAREARLLLKDIRVKADHKRKELKEDSIRYGRAVQGVYNVIDYLIRPLEEHLGRQEKFVEELKKKRLQELREAREAELEPYAAYVPVNLNPAMLDEDDYQRVLKGAKLQKEEDERKEREAAKQAADREERNRVNRERARESVAVAGFIPDYDIDLLYQYSPEEWENALAEANAKKAAHDQEQKQIAKQKAEAEAKLEAERKEREAAERKAAEAREKERAAAQRKLDEERQKREKLEKEQREREAAERKAESERIERERAEALAREQAPDKEKLNRLAAEVAELRANFPKLESDAGQKIGASVDEALGKVVTYITEKTAKL